MLACAVVSPAQNCSGLQTCGQCLEQPECGWCGDPSSTGRGLCIEGSYRGPMKRPAKQGQQAQNHNQNQDMSLEPAVCPRDKGYEWAFISCPGEWNPSGNYPFIHHQLICKWWLPKIS